MAQNNKIKLYEALKSEGYDNFKSQSDFDSYIHVPANRKKLFDALKQEGFDNFSDEKSFDDYLGYADSEGSVSNQVVAEYDASVGNNPVNRMKQLINENKVEKSPSLRQMVKDKPQVAVTENVRPTASPSVDYSEMPGSERHSYIPERIEPIKRDKEKELEEKELDANFKAKPVQSDKDIFDNYMGRFSNTRRGIELDTERAEIQAEVESKYISKFKNSPEYKEIAGKKYDTQEEANKALSDAFYGKYGETINNEMRPYMDAINKEMFSRYGYNINEEMRKLNKKNTSEQVNDLEKEVGKLLEEKHDALRHRGGSGGNAMNALMGSTSYNQSTAAQRQEIGALESAQRLLEQSQEIIAEAGRKGNTNFVGGLARGFRDNMDWENFTLGLAEMADAKYLNNALEKADKGEQLTPAEEKLLEASVTNMATQAYFSSDLGRGYGAGQTTAVSLPFMLEFIANPISGSGNAIAKSLLKFGLKKFGHKGAGKGALNAFGRALTSKGGKMAGRLVGDAGAAIGMEGTTGVGRVAAGTLDRLNENYDYSLDDNGNLQVKKVGNTSLGGALARSAASTFLENQSEMVFNAFRGWTPFMKAADNVLPGRVSEFMNRIKNSKPGQLYSELKNNPTFREMVERAQFRGLPEEYMEEVYNNFANVAIGEMSVEDAVDLDNNINTFLGLAPTSAMFAALGLGGMAHERLVSKRKMSKIFGKFTDEQKHKFEELQRMPKEAGNTDIREFIKMTIADESLSQEEKRAEIEYAFELAKQNAMDDIQSKQPENERAADEAYNEGTEMPPEQHYSAEQEKTLAGDALRNADEGLFDTVDGLLADDGSQGEIDNLVNGLPEEQKALVLDYIEKSKRVDGVIDAALEEAIDAGDNAANVLNDAIVEDENGNRTITTALYKDGTVYVLADDGKHATILRDGKKEMVASDNLEEVQRSDADAVVDNIRNDILQGKQDELNNSLNHHPKTQEPQAGMQLWNGDVPFIVTDVSADGVVQAFPAERDAKTGQMVPKKDGLVNMTVEEAKLLQDDYYKKMAAAEKPEIAAITDESVDNTLENQAENASSPEMGESKVSETDLGNDDIIPIDEKGNVLYYQVPVEVTVADLTDGTLDNAEIDGFVSANQIEADKLLDKVKKSAPKIGTNKAKYLEDKKAWQAKVDEAQQQSDYWKEVSAFIKLQREQPGDKVAEEIMAMGEPLDGLELAAQRLAGGNLPLLYEDYKRELGFGDKEAGKMFGLFKSRENGGLTIEEAGELLMQDDLEAGTNFFDPSDANAGRNAILDVLSSARTRGDLTEFIRKNREAMAERERSAEEEHEEMQREAWAQENFGMNYADYVTFNEVIDDIIREKAIPEEEIREFYNTFAEELNNWNNGRVKEETEGNDRGTDSEGGESGEGVLPDEQLGDIGGVEADTPAETDVNADNEGVPAPEESVTASIEEARKEVAPNPTDTQKEAGNYKKGHVKIDGYDITIENPTGSERSGTDANGNKWSVIMNNDYGYIRGTEGVDGDHIDVFLSDFPTQGHVYVVDQLDVNTGKFDEHKVMYGFGSIQEATDAYLANYSPGWMGIGAVTEVSKDEFKKWIESSRRKTKPFAEYKSIKTVNSLEENDTNALDVARDRLANLEQEWRDRILDYIAEHYPTQATVSAQTNSPKGIREKTAMKEDEILKRMRSQARDEINAADEKVMALSKTENAEDDTRFRIVHHGTGTSFDKFSTEKIGTGEGNQSFGWGLYFTDKKDIAQYYAETIGDMPSYVLYKDGKPADMNDEISRVIYNYDGDVKKAIRSIKRNANMWKKEGDEEFAAEIMKTADRLKLEDPNSWEMKEDGNRHIYDVEIPDTGFLHWDNPMTDEQKRLIIEQAGKEGIKISFYGDLLPAAEFFEKMGGKAEGAQIYKAIERTLDSDKEASLFLNRAGFNGIEYVAGRHSGKKSVDSNFVIFDENAVRIINHLQYREQESISDDGKLSIEDAVSIVRKFKKSVPGSPEIAIITNEEDIDNLRVGDITKGSLKRALNNPRVTGCYSNRAKMVFVFPSHTSGASDFEDTLAHETAHYASRKVELPEKLKESVLEYVKEKYPEVYSNVEEYPEGHRAEEAVAYLFEKKCKEFGIDRVLKSKFAGDKDVVVVFTEITNFLNHGKGREHNPLGEKEGERREPEGRESPGESERSVYDAREMRRDDVFREGDPEGYGGIETRERGTQEAGNAGADNVRETTEGTDADGRRSVAPPAFDPATDDIIEFAERVVAFNRNNSRPDKPDEDAIRYRMKATSPLSSSTVGAWDKLASSKAFLLRETSVDYLTAVDKFQDLVAKRTGSRVLDYENAYQALLALSSKNKEEMDRFEAVFVNPLNKAIMKITGGKKAFKKWNWKEGALRDLVMYVEAKHGLERNRVMNQEKETEAEDYSGLSSIFGDKEKYPEGWQKAAEDYVNDYESSHKKEDVKELWNNIRATTGYALNKQLESGLVSKEYVEKQLGRFEYYVPLRGFADEIAEDVYGYANDGIRRGANPVKTAEGRSSEAGNPFGSILQVCYSSISAGNKNLAKQKLYYFVNNHDTDGLTVVNRAWRIRLDELGNHKDLLVQYQPKAGEELPEWVEAAPNIPDNPKEGEVTDIMRRFEELMEKLKGEEKTAEAYAKSKTAYRTLHNQRSEHEIPLMVGGNRRVITVTGNPRLAQAVNGLLNPADTEKGVISEYAGRMQRFMAGAFTSNNIAFAFANLSKDTMYANNQAFIKENGKYWMKFTKNQKLGFAEFPHMIGLLSDYQKGKLNENSDIGRMFKEFMENGGATGYTFVGTQKEYTDKLEKELKKLAADKRKSLPKNIIKGFFDLVEFGGQAAELVNRFAAYRTSREMGRSISRSVSDAKEITVNFNRKGAGIKTAKVGNEKTPLTVGVAAALSQYGRSSLLFFNANMQAKYRMYKNLREHPIKTSASLIGGSMIFGGVMVPFLNYMVLPALYTLFGWDGDDDYYDTLTDYERTHNICLRLRNGYWLKIPLSPEMIPWYSIGDMVGGAIMGKRNMEASDFGKSFVDAFTPVGINWELEGGKFLLNFVPSVSQPIGQHVTNVNFMGVPLSKEDPWGTKEYDPEYKKVYNGTSPTLVELSRLNNSLFGGDDVKSSGSSDWNPRVLQNYISGYTGGFGTTVLALGDLVTGMMQGDKAKNDAFSIAQTPILSRFLISGDKDVKLRRLNSQYHEVNDFIDEYKHDLKGYYKAMTNADEKGDMLEYAEYKTKYDKLVDEKSGMYEDLVELNNAVKEFNGYLKENPDDERSRDMLYELMLRGIERMKKKE